MTAKEIINSYISFYEKRGHKRIENASLVPQNDPTTLFTSSGMQPLVPYLLGETHPQGTRLVNVQNCFRAVDIEEVGNNRHTTFYRMLGNWSLGDYFKKEQLTWIFEFLTQELNLDPNRFSVSIFSGYKEIPKDTEAEGIWKELFDGVGINPKERIYEYTAEKNWWSRAGVPEKMPPGEPGGPDSEIFYDFGADLKIHENSPFKNEKCHINCDCGRYWEICNSVFMQYKKNDDGSFSPLPKQNVDFGAGLERFIGATENKPDMFETSLFKPTISQIEKQTNSSYTSNRKPMQIIADHFGGSIFMVANKVKPANKDQGYILRRLIRRALDNFYQLGGKEIIPILEAIVGQYKDTDPYLVDQYEKIKGVILEEQQAYARTLSNAKKYIEKKYGNRHSGEERSNDSRIKDRSWTSQDDGSMIVSDDTKKIGDELMGTTEITAEDAFVLYTTHGLSPTQIKSLGYTFDDLAFAQKMEEHQKLSRAGAQQKFAGGLADHQERTVMGHTATHLLHQALRDVLGNHVHQTGSNITTQRLRFDFNFDRKLTDEEIKKVQTIINEKIKENLPVHFEMIPTTVAEKMGAIGLFKDTYGEKSKIYFIGDGSETNPKGAYSIEFCGGPHVDFTGKLKNVTIQKQENIGHGQRRIYAVVNS